MLLSPRQLFENQTVATLASVSGSVAAVEAERQAGTDPSDARLAPLVERWTALVAAFTGGDEATRAALQRMYEENDPEQVSRGAMNAETMAYAMRAIDARGGYPG